MTLSRHFTFANVASALALTVALSGGVAVAAGLAKNSVGPAQIKKDAVRSSDIKNNAVKGKDIKNNTVKGKDIDESSLDTVPSVDKLVFDDPVTALPGQNVTVATRGPLTITLRCIDNGGGDIGFEVVLTTSANGTTFDANVSGSDENILNVGDEGGIGDDNGTGQTSEHLGFAAIAPGGTLWQGYGLATAKFAGSPGCMTQLVYVG